MSAMAESGSGSAKKSLSTFAAQAKLKIPKYDPVDVELRPKTIKDPASINFKDRSTLLTIPPKDEGASFAVGDLIWAKMTGYPWWPCIVSIDPVTGTYFKVTGSSYKADRVYHVQYFGPDPSRGWTSIGMVMPFEGFDKFSEKISNDIDNAANKPAAQKVLEKCTVKPGIKKKWNESVAEAQEAMKLNRQERVQTLTFNYTGPGSDIKPKKVPTTPKASAVNNNSATPKASTSGKKRSSSGKGRGSKREATSDDVYEFPEDSDGPDGEAIPGPLSFRSRPAQGDFQVYLRKHFDEAQKKNPDRSKLEINEYLKEEWDKLPEKDRQTYTERKAIQLDDAAMFVAKRSNFDDDYSNDSDYDYDGSDEGKESPGDDVSSNLIISRASTSKGNAKTKRSTSLKSEKLFDKIKNAAGTNGIDSGDQGGSSRKRNRSASNIASTPTTSKKLVTSKSSGKAASKSVTPKTNSHEADANDKEDLKSPMKSPGVKRKLCFPEESYGEDTTSEDGDQIEAKIKVKQLDDRFCYKCSDDETPEVGLLTCLGPCQRLFHRGCAENATDLEDGVSTFKCEECTNGKYKCFACQSPDDLDTLKCEDSKCARYYHLKCIEHSYPIRVNENAHTFTCPLHTCLTCYHQTLEDNEYRANKKKLLRCIWCPTAFHQEIFCISAGTIRVSRNFIICPKHNDVQGSSKSRDKHINVNYCFSCLSGGNLVCCESCPSAFHVECLEYTFDENKSFYCSACLQHKQLYYGDIVWVKLGSYRWWPGRICHPDIVPQNVMNLNHNSGDFPVYFFGTHDYFWTNKGRVYLYLTGDHQAAKNSGKSSSNKLKSSFNKALEEAEEAHHSWIKKRKDSSLATIATKPPHYQLIQANRYTCKVNGNGNDPSDHVCECKADSPCEDDDCLNRVICYECNSESCPVKAVCKNMRFTKMEYAQVKPFKTKNAGWGLMAMEDIKEGQFVIEYVGEVIDKKECDQRLKKNATDNISNFYFLNLDKDLVIDAGPKGNLARFMNHSCEPNCVTQKWTVNKAPRVGLFALKDIPAGSELTFNYNLDCRGNERTKCKCESTLCSGFIGDRPRSPEEAQNNNQKGGRSSLVNGKSKKRRRSSSRKSSSEPNSE